MSTKCNHCGESIADGATFCPKCGNDTGLDATLIDRKPAAAPAKSNKWTIIYVVVLLLAAIIGGVGGYLYVTNRDKAPADAVEEAPELPTVIVEEEAEDIEHDAPEDGDVVTSEASFDYDKWNDLNDFFDADAVGMLDLGRYSVNTAELCRDNHSWRKTTIGKNDHEAIIYAHPSLRLRSTPSTVDNSNVLNGMHYGTRVRVLEIVNNEWAKVEYMAGELDNMSVVANGEPLVGYVNLSFLINVKMFSIMDRHITGTEEDRDEFDVSKWRRAATDLIYALGATATGTKIDVEIEENWTYKDDMTGEEMESLVVFGLERKDSDVKLLAFVEFFAEDEEYRILGIVPGEAILNVRMLGSGNYDIIYTTDLEE